MKKTFFCVLALSVVSPVFAGTFRHDRSNIQHVNLAQDSRYQSVGFFEGDLVAGELPLGSFSASGVLISPEWVLTAAHVVDGIDNAGGGLTNFQFTIGGNVIPAAEQIVHEAWTESQGDLFAGWDVGLVRLSQPVLNTAPATLYTGDDELGQVGTIVGFGLSGTGLGGEATPAGIKRAGHNIIDGVGRELTPGSDTFFAYDHDRLLSVDFDSPLEPGLSALGDTQPLDLEYSDARGDSGGGVFIEVDGQTQVAGIVSLGRTDRFDETGLLADYGDVSGYSRVSRFLDWIEGHTGLDLTPEIVVSLGAEFGDFDGDGLVTTSDYDRWIDEFGTSGTSITADANGDGRVNLADYAVWREAYGNATSESLTLAAIPEPSGLALLAAAALTGALRRR